MDEPYFELSKKTVLAQYALVRQVADIVSYSSKTNQQVTPILEEGTDSMFSVHFENELKHVKDKGRVIFLAQAWDDAQIRRLLDLGIRSFVVDNESDLDILLKFLESENPAKITLYLRVKLRENTLRTERFFVFGMPSSVVNKRLKELKGHKAIASLGLHFHRKTQNTSEWNIISELQEMLGEDAFSALNYVNIGGGLPTQYANTNQQVLPGIFRKIVELKAWLNSRNILLVLEPGRFIAAPACKLVTRIIGIHENNIVVNASIYNSDLDSVVVPVKLLVEGELAHGQGKPYVVKGVTPCSVDLFRYRVYLHEQKVGQALTFLNAGAYNFSSDFCDLEKLETRVVD
jgi:ornithine decarboxylase